MNVRRCSVPEAPVKKKICIRFIRMPCSRHWDASPF
jgi:hypothetical protein